jgi:eukaryotic-like serine/threonine-protein kinase
MTTLSAERWQRLQQLLDEVLERPLAERESAAAKLAVDDDVMRGELLRLLQAGARSDDFLSRPAAELGVSLVIAPPTNATASAHGRQIGHYRILREIGRGGMGAVFLAERADDQFRQVVALKLLPHEWQNDIAIRRFLDERQILATMEHPAIARLIDGGVTDDALPYFVMQYVDGIPIDRYCDEQRLTIEKRLRLFCEVCAAVQYAHAKLVVHRDIKPSNILVTAAGDVRLLDFGIAKLLSESTESITSSGARIMTPEYASPEQVRGEPVTTASDVYSLGVLLYRLLTGQRPYRITGCSQFEIERAIVEEEPRAPSAVIGELDSQMAAGTAGARETTPERLQRRLAGDLDVIVLRALHKQSDRRYGSVEQFATDLRRYLDGRPVLARRDTLRYRVRKFAGRNRTAVGASALAAIALLGGTAFSVRQARHAMAQARIAASERDHALREEEEARQTANFLFTIFQASDPSHSHGAAVTARELLDRGARNVDRELPKPTDIRAGVLHEIGRAYLGLEDTGDAIRMLERAVADRVALHGSQDPDVALTLLDYGDALYHAGRKDSAERVLERAASQSRRFFGNHDRRTADALNSLALSLQTLARYADAGALHKEALAMRRELHDSAGMTVSLVNIAWIEQSAGHSDSAVKLVRSVVEIRRRLYGSDDPRTFSAVSSLGDLYRRQRAYDAAEPLLREALATGTKLFGPRSGNVGELLAALAEVSAHHSDVRSADSLYREAISVERLSFGQNDARTAQAMNNYAGWLNERGQYGEALRWYTDALAAYRSNFGVEHPFVGIVLGNVANTHHLLGHADRADTLYRQAIALMRKVWHDDNPSVVNATISHGLVLLDLTRNADAEHELRDALVNARHAYPAGHWRLALAENALGAALSARRRFQEADTLLVHGYDGLTATLGPTALDTRLARRRLVAHYRRWGRPELAARYRGEGT